jgi:hypothetical protein
MIQKPFSSDTLVVAGLATIGLLIHGTQAGRLGLYWEESINFLHAMQNVDGDVMRFIFSDPQHFLPSERPLAYLSFVVSRAGFAVSLSLAHWISVVLLVLTAVVLAMLARRIVDETWLSFAVGVIFLTYPLSPLQAIWISTVFYLWASLLALLAMLLFLHGLNASATGRLRWFVFAALAYLASILVHEEFILIPPTFVSLYLLSIGGRESSNPPLLRPIFIRRAAAYSLGLCLIPTAVYALWREMALPSFGFQIYSMSTAWKLEALTKKFLTGVQTAFMPTDDAATQILSSPPAPGYVFLSAILSLGVWAIILRLRSSETRQADTQKSPWLYAATCGVAMAMSGIIFLVMAPVYIGGVVGTGWSSRVNFVMTLGMALAVPGFLDLLVSPNNRFTPLAGLLSVSLLIYAGFTSSFLDIVTPFRPSTFSMMLGEYSTTHRLAIFGYLIGGAFLILTLILSSLVRAHRAQHLPKSDRLHAWWSFVSAHFVAGTVASLVFLGSLFQFSIKGEYAAKWSQHKLMLNQLQRLAPALKDNTFVVLVRSPNDPVNPSHYAFSSYLIALYGNRSIMGNIDSELRFHLNGVESTYHGENVNWYDSSAPESSGRRTRIRRISYDRLLIFEFDGRNLRMLPKMAVKTEEGEPLVMLNNPDRILSGTPVRTVVWQYIAG